MVWLNTGRATEITHFYFDGVIIDGFYLCNQKVTVWWEYSGAFIIAK